MTEWSQIRVGGCGAGVALTCFMVDSWPGCLHCEYMNSSLPLAQCSVGGRQLSVPSRGVPRKSDTGHPFGFTLIELLVVVAIIAILAGLTLSTLGYVNRKGAESRARAEVAALSAAIDSYRLEFGTYPSNQASLYRELTGTATGAGAVNTNKVLFEPTPSMVTNMATGPFIDPWGFAYEYRVGAQATNNVGFFDLWSTAGNAAAANAPNWIRN